MDTLRAQQQAAQLQQWATEQRQLQKRAQQGLNTAQSIGKKALDFLILDDINTLRNPDASWFEKGFALASFFPVGKVLKGGKLIAKVAGKSDDVLRLLAKKGLNPRQIKKYRGFVTDRGKGLPIRIYAFPNGGKVFEVVKPGKSPGHYAHYEKYIDKSGETVIFGKRSYDPRAQFKHWHEYYPFNGLELVMEEKYLIRVKQIVEYNKL